MLNFSLRSLCGCGNEFNTLILAWNLKLQIMITLTSRFCKIKCPFFESFTSTYNSNVYLGPSLLCRYPDNLYSTHKFGCNHCSCKGSWVVKHCIREHIVNDSWKLKSILFVLDIVTSFSKLLVWFGTPSSTWWMDSIDKHWCIFQNKMYWFICQVLCKYFPIILFRCLQIQVCSWPSQQQSTNFTIICCKIFCHFQNFVLQSFVD